MWLSKLRAGRVYGACVAVGGSARGEQGGKTTGQAQSDAFSWEDVAFVDVTDGL